MEKCTWQCKHLQCSKLCSEPCDRELCKHPDTKLIPKCQHPSIGVCGEKMPRLCRICDKDNVEEIFLGKEDEPDARFIELEDCKHVIEVNGLIHWLNSEPDSNSDGSNNNKNSIQFQTCPKCKTVIRHTKSLNKFIQASLRDIQQVKVKTCGTPEVNKKTQQILFEKVKRILNADSFKNDSLHLRSIYESISEDTKFKGRSRAPQPNQVLVELENKLNLLERLRKICSNFEGRPTSQQNICNEAIEKFNSRLRMAASFIKLFKNCEQQRDDISTEISFLQLMCDVIVKASGQPFNDSGKKLLDNAFELANKYGSATESVRIQFQKIVQEASKHCSGIGISVEEKEMVLKAFGLKRGHWYKCRNGHVYVITECGGAMQRAICPERGCGAPIGGEQHHLDTSNAVATEMDGARFAAWPPRE